MQEERSSRWTRLAFRITLLLVCLGALTAVVGMASILFVNVESVVASGPALATLGSLLFATSLVCRHWYALALALSMWFVSALFFGLVMALGWGPSDAGLPFSVMSVIYVVLALPLAVIALLHRPACVFRPPWECQRCGYLLFGLFEPRCPECGTAFDPTQVPAAPSM